jgi:hypothetical protein
MLEGKAKASRNAFKGVVMQQIKLMGKQLNRLIREQKQLMDG